MKLKLWAWNAEDAEGIPKTQKNRGSLFRVFGLSSALEAHADGTTCEP
jgi:hypothetical protein